MVGEASARRRLSASSGQGASASNGTSTKILNIQPDRLAPELNVENLQIVGAGHPLGDGANSVNELRKTTLKNKKWAPAHFRSCRLLRT